MPDMIGFPKEIQKKVIAYGHDKQKFLVSDECYYYIYPIIKKKCDEFHISIPSDFIHSLTMSLLKQSHSDRHNHYVEHGAPHAIRVGENMINIHQFLQIHEPAILYAIAMELKLNPEHHALPFIFWVSGILHDCNYYINQTKNEVKTIHSLKSALTAYDILTTHFPRLFDIDSKDSSGIIKTMTNAILCHNGDTIDEEFSQLLETPIRGIPYNNKNKLKELIHYCLRSDTANAFIDICCHTQKKIVGRKCHKNSALFGIPFKESSMSQNALLFILRLADDFDSTHERLLPIQKKMLDFLLPFAKAYMENQMDDKAVEIGHWPWHTILSEFKSKSWDLSSDEQTEGIAFLNRIIETNQTHSFQCDYHPEIRFYVGLWLIKKINLFKNGDRQLAIKVTIKSSSLPHEQECIHFYRNIHATFDKNDQPIKMELYYGKRILREGMNLIIN